MDPFKLVSAWVLFTERMAELSELVDSSTLVDGEEREDLTQKFKEVDIHVMIFEETTKTFLDYGSVPRSASVALERCTSLFADLMSSTEIFIRYFKRLGDMPISIR